MKEFLIKLGFNALMLGIFIIVLLVMMNGKGNKTENHIEVTVKLDKKPVVNNYHITQPTLIREKTIEYSTTHVMTKQDSDRIVIDYLKERYYSDSIYNDTSKVKYQAIVSKNSLKDMKIQHSYKPKIIEIKETKIKNGLLVGLAPGWFNGPTIGFLAGFETKNITYGIQYDPIKNPKGGYLLIQKRIFFR